MLICVAIFFAGQLLPGVIGPAKYDQSRVE